MEKTTHDDANCGGENRHFEAAGANVGDISEERHEKSGWSFLQIHDHNSSPEVVILPRVGEARDQDVQKRLLHQLVAQY